MLLEARNITKAFGAFKAVDDASVAVNAGEVLGLIGPNGAGKSTFFNCLTGDLAPSSGSVHFQGRDVTALAPEARARVGIARTFQVPLTFVSMSVLDNVTIGAFLRRPKTTDARAKAREVIDFVGLGAHVDAPAASLGTPGRKRLEIARALACEPEVLLLDEAMAGLTPAEIRTAIELVRRIHARGITLIIVEHIMEVIVSLAERVVVFHQGREIARGTPVQVTRDTGVIEAYLGKRHAQKLRGGAA
ncbi:MAG TPA: ABC transporter ATP-binding protein [Hyphomicrobiaceae bacterium]|nr:ABC transporter ATP-binding protein [Hyphomicrobiaceae bacterium]